MKKALITGFSGQDGSYLAENLLSKGYDIFGLVRRVSTPNIKNIEHLINNPKVHIEDGDITDLSSLINVLHEVQPDEIYNLAAQSYVALSWEQPTLTCNTTGLGALNVFEAARITCPGARIYQASSSEMFSGKIYPQNESTVFEPRSPYGVAKLFAHKMAHVYRQSYGMFIVSGILFNHESPRRGIEFVTQKIVTTLARQLDDKKLVLKVGNIEACRDWSHAADMVEGMYLMLQQSTPKDYILASGKTWYVRNFIDTAYEHIFGEKLHWEDLDTIGVLPKAYSSEGRLIVKSVKEFYRPNEVDVLCGDSRKAREELKWEPKYSFESLIFDMINYSL